MSKMEIARIPVKLIETGERTRGSEEFGYKVVIHLRGKDEIHYQNRATLIPVYGRYELEEEISGIYRSFYFPTATSVKGKKRADLSLYKRARNLANRIVKIQAEKLQWIFAQPELKDETQMFKSLLEKKAMKEEGK